MLCCQFEIVDRERGDEEDGWVRWYWEDASFDSVSDVELQEYKYPFSVFSKSPSILSFISTRASLNTSSQLPLPVHLNQHPFFEISPQPPSSSK